MQAPTITGTIAGQGTTSEAPVHPFSGVTIGDLNVGATDTLTITLNGAGGTLSGAGLSGSGNTYILSGTASAITSALDALVFTPAAGQPNTSGTTTFTLSDVSTDYTSYASTPTVLASFNGTNGARPYDGGIGGLIRDAAGNLFGTTESGGANGFGTVFEIAKSGSGYGALTVLASFTGGSAWSGLTMDAAGDLFSTTYSSGTDGYGTVFEIVKNGSSYNAPTVLASLNSRTGQTVTGNLITDAAGNLFGMSLGIGYNGTLLEIVKTGSTYSSAPTVLATLSVANGTFPFNGMTMDAAGNLFTTAQNGGANSAGTVIEFVKSGSTYSSTPTTLVSFNGTNGQHPVSNLIADAAGNLFGATSSGGANNLGTVFEILKTGGSYSSTPTVLVSFNTPSSGPVGNLAMDAAGDIFGTTRGSGGTYGSGTAFEIVKTGSGYSSTATILTSFSGTSGMPPSGGLVMDAAGNLIGTTDFGGANNDGVVFELLKGTGQAVDSTTTVINSDPPAVFNVPPTISTGASATVAEDTALVFSSANHNAITVADVDGGSGSETMTLSVAHGTLALASLAGLTGVTGNNSGSVTFSGTLAALNAALDGLVYQGTHDYNGADTLNIGINDNGHTGTGGALTASATEAITVSAVNDAPVNTVPGAFSTATGVDHAIAGLSVNDVDATSMTTTLHVDHGTLAVAAIGGVTVAGSGTGTVTITGSVAQIDAALSAANNVLYHSTAGFIGADQLTMTSNDGGGTGSGGPLSDTDTVAITVLHKSIPFDFDANGHSDMLWYNDNGTASIWDNGQIDGGHWIANPGTLSNGWHFAGAGDFDGNGHADILWRNDNGSVWTWDNGQLGSGHVVADPGVVASSWHIAGTGDFDGNGRDDILWSNDNGAVSIWDNGQIGGTHVIADAGVVASSWHIAGTGDFDGNGRSDILWVNDNGAASIWDNGQIGGGHAIADTGTLTNGWHFAGTGDFDGNGHSDILWVNDNGAASIWDNGMVGGAHIIAATGTLSNGWHFAMAGDFDANGKSDILWNNDNTALSIWNDGQISGAHIVEPAGAIPHDWHVV